jgi:hypothetical protein
MTSRSSLLARIRNTVRAGDQWLKQTPLRSLEQAYEAALLIKAMEDEYFSGNKISAESGTHSDTVLAYFQGKLQKHLTTAKVRVAEFKLSHAIVNFFSSDTDRERLPYSMNGSMNSDRDRASVILEKLKFIDEVIEKYIKPHHSRALVRSPVANNLNVANSEIEVRLRDKVFESAETISDKTGVLPRSILGTISRIQKNLDPEAESEVIQNFRTAKTRTFVSIRFILLLILVTLGTQIFTKTLFVGPVVDHLRDGGKIAIFINNDLQDEAFLALNRYEDKLKFQSFIGQIESPSSEKLEAMLKRKASEIADDFKDQSADAIKNVFADLFSFVSFGLFIALNRRDIEILKSFIDEVIYGLSDSAKAFIIILFTDIFVGFHSPHGWEVILEGIARHFGVPENRQFIFIFIATFPVILDTVFKYWIFRYLNRVSPSAVATLRNMNE